MRIVKSLHKIRLTSVKEVASSKAVIRNANIQLLPGALLLLLLLRRVAVGF